VVEKESGGARLFSPQCGRDLCKLRVALRVERLAEPFEGESPHRAPAVLPDGARARDEVSVQAPGGGVAACKRNSTVGKEIGSLYWCA